jgi:membrane protein YdbS with pleckstrin-like domain
MGERLQSWLFRLLRVPAEPAPLHDSGDLRAFRASPNLYRYNLAKWGLTQGGALVGLLVGLVLLRTVPGLANVTWGLSVPVFRVLEAFMWITFLVQLPVTYAMIRLDYELRWYLVSDRSLRIHQGLTTVREQTVTFANIQHMTVRQGPLQRLLGIADLEVRTAGGGASQAGQPQLSSGSLHTAYFRGVDNADEIRDLIRERVLLHRDAGLGDPDDAGELVPPGAMRRDGNTSLLDAAAELLAEVRALRRTASPE